MRGMHIIPEVLFCFFFSGHVTDRCDTYSRIVLVLVLILHLSFWCFELTSLIDL